MLKLKEGANISDFTLHGFKETLSTYNCTQSNVELYWEITVWKHDGSIDVAVDSVDYRNCNTLAEKLYELFKAGLLEEETC